MAPMGKKSQKLLNKQHSIICLLYAIPDSVFAVLVKIIYPLLIVAFLISCGDRAPVDREYLESEKYRTFSEKESQEQNFRIENYKSLEKYLAEFGQCDLGKERNYPLQVDNRILEQEFSTCEGISNKYNTNFRIQNFGYSSFEDILIRWIIVQRESIYEDTEFIAATYRDGSLVGFQTVGVFRQNLQQHISTNIKVERQENNILIRSSMIRGIKYPFNYDNVIQSSFRIDTLGVVEEHTDQSTSYQSLPGYLEELNGCARGKQWVLPIQINDQLLDDNGISCETRSYNTNFTTRSVGFIANIILSSTK